MNYPKVDIDKMTFIESSYENKEGFVWNAVKLREAAKDLPVFEIPLASIDLSKLPFRIDSMDSFLFQMRRVQDTDLKYPIILDACGTIADGYHRICKAILKGDKTIKAVRLNTMPEADSKNELE